MLIITPTLSLDESELVERFVRSSGPGGQNVNKVASSVQLRFDIRTSPSLAPWIKSRLLARSDSRITDDGVVVIEADRFRTRERNREDARLRLVELIRAALIVPKRRKPTTATKGSQERRIGHKLKQGRKKTLRKQPISED